MNSNSARLVRSEYPPTEWIMVVDTREYSVLFHPDRRGIDAPYTIYALTPVIILIEKYVLSLRLMGVECVWHNLYIELQIFWRYKKQSVSCINWCIKQNMVVKFMACGNVSTGVMEDIFCMNRFDSNKNLIKLTFYEK